MLDYENSEGNKQEKTAYAGDPDFIYDGTVTEDGVVYDVYRVQENVVGNFNASDVKIIRVSGAQVNNATPDDPQQIEQGQRHSECCAAGVPDSISNSGKNYSFKVNLAEYPAAARIMTHG